MMFTASVMVLLMLAALTFASEYARTKSLTLLSIISLGNVLYMGVTPALYYYLPDGARIFEQYVGDAGLSVAEPGLTRVLLAASAFQFACLFVSVDVFPRKHASRPDVISDKSVQRAAAHVGWGLILVGVLGAISLGLEYNGSPFGLYQITYFDRPALVRENAPQAFMLLLGIYGATQLLVVYLLTQRTGAAALLLLAVTLHGLGIKSKFPIFWVLLVFLVVAVGQRGQILRLMVPAVIAGLVLSTMSVLRGVEYYSDLPHYIETYWGLIGETIMTPWENDLPGPVSILYYVLNSNSVEHTIAPVAEIVLLLVPRFFYDRGLVISDLWAQKMIGNAYEPGLGFGWSPICDGYILAGWGGIVFVALIFAGLARYITSSGGKFGQYKEFIVIVGFCSVPLFLFGVRESFGSLIKQLLIMTSVVWLPTLLLSNVRKAQAVTSRLIALK